jgi:hypothetical protein
MSSAERQAREYRKREDKRKKIYSAVTLLVAVAYVVYMTLP